MRAVGILGPLVFLAGLAALGFALLQGQATLSLFLVIPVLTASGPWGFLGILLLVAGFALSFLLWSPRGEARPEPAPPAPAAAPPEARPVTPRRWGGVVFLGPIPVVFGSDVTVTRWMLVVGVVLFLALLVLTLIALRAI